MLSRRVFSVELLHFLMKEGVLLEEATDQIAFIWVHNIWNIRSFQIIVDRFLNNWQMHGDLGVRKRIVATRISNCQKSPNQFTFSFNHDVSRNKRPAWISRSSCNPFPRFLCMSTEKNYFLKFHVKKLKCFLGKKFCLLNASNRIWCRRWWSFYGKPPKDFYQPTVHTHSADMKKKQKI